jgi:hypothetical protein
MSLRLVQLGLTDAAMFGPTGEVLQPSEVLYKKPVLVERGSFRPVTRVNLDMLQTARAAFGESLGKDQSETVELMEITMKNLMASGTLDLRDFLARADVLAAAGKTVLISDYFEYYRLVHYFRRYTAKPVAIVLGAGSLLELFDEKYYADLDGGVLESFGRLFNNDTRLYVYPLKDQRSGELGTVSNLTIPTHLQKLYGHLVDRGCILPLEGYDPECLGIFSRDVTKRIQAGDARWESEVPREVAEVIKSRGLFGCRKGQPAGA